MTNSTINDNVNTGFASTGGVGIYNASGGAVYVSNCTISGNPGTGLSNQFGGPFSVKSSIVALNGKSVASPFEDDVLGSFTSAGFNLIGNTDGSTGFTQDTDQTGTTSAPLDPGLDPLGLQDHGGPTFTIALLALSPALDKGTSAGLTGNLATDQRGTGFARTFDDPAVLNPLAVTERTSAHSKSRPPFPRRRRRLHPRLLHRQQPPRLLLQTFLPG